MHASDIIRYGNQALYFGLELCMFVGFGLYGAYLGKTGALKITAAIMLTIIAISLWGLFAAPTSSMRLAMPWLLIFQSAMFMAASIALWIAGRPSLGLSLFCAYACSALIAIYFNDI